MKPFLKRLAIACGVVVVTAGLSYLPFVRVSGLAELTSNRWVKPLTWTELASGALGRLWEYAVFWHRGLPHAAVAALALGLALSLAYFRRLSSFRVNPLVVTFATCVSMMALQRVLPPERVLLPVVPLYLGSCAAGLRWLAEQIAVRAKRSDARLFEGGSGSIVAGALTLLVAAFPAALVLGNGAAYQTQDQVIFSDAGPIALVLKGILRVGDVVLVQSDASLVLQYYFDQTGISLAYLRARRPGPNGRVFVVDASPDYFLFSTQIALKQSALPRRPYDLDVVVSLPHSTLYRVLEPTG